MPDVFAEWLCVDAHYIIRTTSLKSFIFQFKLIGVFTHGEGCLCKRKAVNLFSFGMGLIL